MKKLILMVAVATSMTAMSCAGSSEKQETGSAAAEQTAAAEQVDQAAWPWDFPTSTGEQLAAGQTVLAPYTYYKVALEKGKNPAEEGLIYYNTTLKAANAGTSTVNYREDYELPNALIIGIPEGQAAKKGDILLTWWQKGSGMKRAIVRDASNPAEPIVDYLDMRMDIDPESKTNSAEREGNAKLKPNSFIVLHDGQWEPGVQVACNAGGKWVAATLIKATDDKVLVSGFGSKLAVYPRKDCKLIPMNAEGVKPGDMVKSLFVGKFTKDVKVDKVDAERGRVWITDDHGKQEIVSVLEMTKVLD